MRMKIAMRESEHPPRDKENIRSWQEYEADVEAAILGRNEGTVRFLFTPPARTEYDEERRRRFAYQNDSDYPMAEY